MNANVKYCSDKKLLEESVVSRPKTGADGAAEKTIRLRRNTTKTLPNEGFVCAA